MNECRTKTLYVLAVIAAILLPRERSLASQSTGRGEGEPTEYQGVLPPPPTWSGQRIRVPMLEGAEGLVWAVAGASTLEKKVGMHWEYFPDYPSWKPRVTDRRTHRVRYWPTHVASLGERTMAVAGMRPDGNTILEKWTFDAPVVDPQGPALAPGAVESTSIVYDAKVPSRDGVLLMGKMQGARTPRLLIQSWDTKDLWSFEPVSGAFTLLASPTPPPRGALHVPPLTTIHQTLSSRNHVEYGYVYTFGAACFVREDDETLVIFDDDRNGTLDGFLLLDESGWGREGFSHPSNYIDHD